MQKSNSYYLCDSNLPLPNLKIWVADILQLFYLKNTDDIRSAQVIVRIMQQELNIAVMVEDAQQVFCEQVSLATERAEQGRLIKLALLTILRKFLPDRAAWGVLRGVRPLKLAHKLLRKVGIDKLTDYLVEHYAVSIPKAQLTTRITEWQTRLLPPVGDIAAVYIGVPYCNSRCTYCSFPSSILPNDNNELELFLLMIEQDIQNVLKLQDKYNLAIKTVYVGGGTPTSLPDEYFSRLMVCIKKAFGNVAEFTLEAGRVDSLSMNKLQAMADSGVTRVSLNAQTLNECTLRRIGRGHTVEEFYRWYEIVRAFAPWQINTDTILGLPGETLAQVEHTFNSLVKLSPDNLTVHTLSYKKDADLFSDIDSYYESFELIKEMMRIGESAALRLNMLPYYLYRQRYILGNLENVGYSKENMASIYNLMIMQEDYNVLGIGPSASSKAALGGGRLGSFFMPKNVAVYARNLVDNCQRRELIFEKRLAGIV